MNEQSGGAAGDIALTGNPQIDDAVASLERLDGLPVESHPEVYDEIHTGLRDALANAGRGEDPAQGS